MRKIYGYALLWLLANIFAIGYACMFDFKFWWFGAIIANGACILALLVHFAFELIGDL